MAVVHTSALQSIAAFSFNILATVLIVTVNRDLLTTRGFNFPCTLAGLHFITTYAYSQLSQAQGGSAAAKPASGDERPPLISVFDRAWFTLVGFLSIGALTVSLEVNTLGIYQVSKLATISVTGLLEFALLEKTFSRLTVASICIVLLGVGSTVSDPGSRVSAFGFVAALISCWAVAGQQVGIGLLQKRYSLSSAELIGQTFGLQAAALLTVGPVIDRMLFGAYPWGWAGFYSTSGGGLVALVASCLCAIAVNFSQVSCIRHLSPVGFQVLGNAKTIAILFVSWEFFDGRVSRQIIGGQAVAVAGMAMYSYSTMQGKPKAKPVEMAPEAAEKEAAPV